MFSFHDVSFDLKCSEKPTILIYNKIDLVESDPESSLRLDDSSQLKSVFISAEKKTNIDGLREILLTEIKKAHQRIFPNWLDPIILDGEKGPKPRK